MAISLNRLKLKRPLILASRSPRRVQLLKEAGLVFDVIPSEVDELQFNASGQDAVGLAVFDEHVRSHLPPSANPNQIKTIVHAMDVVEPKAKTSMEGVCHWLAEKTRRRGSVVTLQ